MELAHHHRLTVLGLEFVCPTIDGTGERKAVSIIQVIQQGGDNTKSLTFIYPVLLNGINNA